MTPLEAYLAIFAATFVYCVPMLVAGLRKHPSGAPIVVITLLLGWTLIGWAVALAWAVSPIKRTTAAG